MKTLTISLIALASIAGIAQASDRALDLRESDTFFGKFSENLNGDRMPYVASDSKALAIAAGDTFTAFDRMNAISEAKEHGSK